MAFLLPAPANRCIQPRRSYIVRRVALFAIILTVSSCVVMAEEALPTQWHLTEIYENMDAWQADAERAIEMIPQYESYRGNAEYRAGNLRLSAVCPPSPFFP